MTLSRRMAVNVAALVAAVAIVGAVGVMAMVNLQRDLADSLNEHERWRAAYERFLYDVGTPILQVRRSLNDPTGAPRRSIEPLRRAAAQLDALDLPGADPNLADPVDRARIAMRRAIGQLQRNDLGDPTIRAELLADLNTAFGVAAELSRRMQGTLAELQSEARRRTTRTIAITAGAGLTIIVIAMVVGIAQHRSVVRPLRRIGDRVDRFAAGEFDQRLPAVGDDELAALARQFNHMADELASLYADLERRVRQASRQLAQSERLASVGYLAAGVAHEINNPLAIIAGQAELALRQLPDDDPLCEKLRVICDETFRCKAITGKLLALSRGGGDERRTVDLRTLVEQVVDSVADLPRFADRRIERSLGEQPLPVTVDANQIKQVALNLLTNAASATQADGRITLIGRRDGAQAVIEVRDDGKGMDATALGRAFEPFYTDRRGSGEPGTGLGLSISHAIIADHAGALTAASDGPGRGSRFTIRLPLAEPTP